MVGLSILLESLSSSSGGSGCDKKKNPQVINKSIMIKSPTNHLPPPPLTPSVGNVFFPVTSFLDSCYHCSQKLLPGKDIYMYKGNRAFCSEACRYKQILMEEKESFTVKRKKKPCPFSCSTSTCNSAVVPP